MSSASSTLFYGLFARTLDLVLALYAWPQLKGPVRALDWIAERRRSGILKTSQASAVERFPPEIWGTIKREVVADELAEQQMRYFREWVEEDECEDCQPPGLSEVEMFSPKLFERCEQAFVEFAENDGLQGTLRGDITDFSLLGNFGITFPFPIDWEQCSFDPIEPAIGARLEYLDRLTPLAVSRTAQKLEPKATPAEKAASRFQRYSSGKPTFQPPSQSLLKPGLPPDAISRCHALLATVPLKPCHLIKPSSSANYAFVLDLEAVGAVWEEEPDADEDGRARMKASEVEVTGGGEAVQPRWITMVE